MPARSVKRLNRLLLSITAGIVIGIGFAANSTTSKGEEKPPKGKPAEAAVGRKGRAIEVIDGLWKFSTDPGDSGLALGWAGMAPTSSIDTPIPALWTTSAAPKYSGTAWYWRAFTIPEEWRGKTQYYRIRFNAVAESATVWLNGVELGGHTGGATPFTFNITQCAKIGADNLLAVRVKGEAKRGPGIWQGVEVMAHDEAYIESVNPMSDDFGRITADLRLLNTSKVSGSATLDVRITTASEPIRQVQKSNQEVLLTPGTNISTFLTSVKAKDLQKWSLDTPATYAFDLLFRQDKDVLDSVDQPFGFRVLSLKDRHVQLNGTDLTLTALSPHLELPIVVSSSDDVEKARDLLNRAKLAGVNVMYLDAPHPELLRLADVTGMLVIEAARHGFTQDQRETEIKELIARDRCHPSILAWNLGDCKDEFAATIRKLDGSRFLLTGSGAKTRLWAPGKSEPETGPLPDGLVQ